MAHSRRQFIKRGLTYVGAGLVVPRLMFGATDAFGQSTGPGSSSRILVIVDLEGGNDGLNTIVPFTDSRYAGMRPTIKLTGDRITQISETLAINSSMSAFKSLYDQNKLAIIQGVGYPQQDRSHFRGTEIWQTSRPDTVVPTGWVGRYLDSTMDSADGQLEAIALGSTSPYAFGSLRAPTATIGSLDAYTFRGDNARAADENNKRATFLALGDDARGRNSTYDFLANTGLTAYSSSQTLRDVATSYTPAVAYPSDPFNFGNNLKLIAQMVDANLGTNVFYTRIGSFDTHVDQRDYHALILGALSNGLAALHADLTAHGRGDDLLAMTFSEFGRRAAENGSSGTDHGAAAPMFVMGNAVSGGIYGDHPSLADLEYGDLRHDIDFRAVYTTIIKRWLEVDPEPILGGTFEDVGFLG